MQANYVAQFERASTKLAANSFGFTQTSRNLAGSTFAELFAQMRSGNNDYGNSYRSGYDDSQWSTNSYTSTQSTSYDDASYNQRISSERMADQESSAERYGDEANTVKADERTETPSYEERDAVSKDQDVSVRESEANEDQSGLLEEKTQTAETDAAAIAAMLEALLAKVGGGESKTGTINLDESTRNKLTSILQELQGKSGQNDTADVLNKLKELLQKNTEIADALKNQLQKTSTGQDGGATLSALKELMRKANLGPESMEMKNNRADDGQDRSSTRSKAEFSLLESAASEHSRRKIHTNLAGQDQSDAGKDARQAEKAMNAMTSDQAGRIQKGQEGSSFQRTLTETGDRIGHGTVAGQNMAAKGAGKAEKTSVNQEATIKNFNEVKALLDKQVSQTKENAVSTMTIKLNPEELGKIKIQLEMLENGKLQGKIFVENEVTKNSLLQHAETMKEQIKAQGVSLEGFEIDLGSENMDQDFNGFDQQGQFDRQSEKSRCSGYADMIYDEEMSDQLKTALQGNVQTTGTLNILA